VARSAIAAIFEVNLRTRAGQALETLTEAHTIQLPPDAFGEGGSVGINYSPPALRGADGSPLTLHTTLPVAGEDFAEPVRLVWNREVEPDELTEVEPVRGRGGLIERTTQRVYRVAG